MDIKNMYLIISTILVCIPFYIAIPTSLCYFIVTYMYVHGKAVSLCACHWWQHQNHHILTIGI